MSLLFSQIDYDKIINLKLFKIDGTFDPIICPPVGVKPEIVITGDFLSFSLMNSVDIKITNFYPDSPLSDYKFIVIEAGYSGQALAAIQGQCTVAFQESPSPDGVTHFQIMTGSVSDVINIPYVVNYPALTFLSLILSDIALKLGISLQSNSIDSIQTYIPVYNHGNVNDFIQKLSKAYSLVIKIDGPYLIVYPWRENTSIVHDITLFSGPPKKDAGKITFQAPWVPQLRAGDILNISPEYMRETFGGAQNTFGNLLSVLQYSFEFGTVSEQNQMTVICLDGAP